jgi:hypothetical protein
MGRPLKKQYFGNVSANGQAIIGNAWVNGDTVARPSWIYKQLSTNSYYWFSVNGQGPATGGEAYLVNGACTGPGQANIAVYPYGGEGGGATAANANLGVSTATVVTSGTGTVTADYGVGNVLNISGGTYTNNQQGNVTVSSVKVRTIAAAVGGSNYSVGDTFTLSGGGYASNVVITVASATNTGGVNAVTISQAGSKTTTGLPADPVTFTSQVTTNVSATGATFNIGWGVNTLTVANAGDYTVLAANPVTLLGSGGGATANLTYLVSSVQVTNGGSGFQPGNEAAVTFSTGNATAVGVVNAAGSVTSISITSNGSGYAARPTVTIAPISSPTLAAKIYDNTVENFSGQRWSWLVNGNTLPGPTWAHINTQ